MAQQGNVNYLRTEALGGIILLVAAITGFILSNSSLQSYYEGLIQFPLRLSIADIDYTKPLIFWINDGLVSIFFLLIGLEIKSMLHISQQSIKEQLSLPMSAAIAGAIVPAIVFSIFNHDDPINMRGWAIPTAMDTAFILGILSFFGRMISSSLKMFLMSLAIIDDILAVLVIAIFYAEELSNISIIASASIVGILVLLNLAGVTRIALYVFFGFLLWLFVLGSGVHTSVAGVLLASTIPTKKEHHGKDLLQTMKKFLHPWVSFLILPLFAFANTDVPLNDISMQGLLLDLPLGIILGLFIGKQLGIFSVTYILVQYGSAKLPTHTSWCQMYGVSVLCGVGFTMSLFIGIIAFESGGPQYDHIVKAAVFAGSFISAVLGSIVLYFGCRKT